MPVLNQQPATKKKRYSKQSYKIVRQSDESIVVDLLMVGGQESALKFTVKKIIPVKYM